ncbi:MAG: hypothetical protein AAF514_22955, partial [Verrucomicrobiota bacterium]
MIIIFLELSEILETPASTAIIFTRFFLKPQGGKGWLDIPFFLSTTLKISARGRRRRTRIKKETVNSHLRGSFLVMSRPPQRDFVRVDFPDPGSPITSNTGFEPQSETTFL